VEHRIEVDELEEVELEVVARQDDAQQCLGAIPVAVRRQAAEHGVHLAA